MTAGQIIQLITSGENARTERTISVLREEQVFNYPYWALRELLMNAVMQAGAMGLPSIVTDINGCNEIIVEGKNGIIIPPKDANTLETAMRRFLEKPEYVAQLAKNARRMITDRYEQLAVWDALLEEYKRLLKEKEIEFKPCTKTT